MIIRTDFFFCVIVALFLQTSFHVRLRLFTQIAESVGVVVKAAEAVAGFENERAEHALITIATRGA